MYEMRGKGDKELKPEEYKLNSMDYIMRWNTLTSRRDYREYVYHWRKKMMDLWVTVLQGRVDAKDWGR